MAAPQHRSWARGVHVSCNGERVHDVTEIVPANVTSVANYRVRSCSYEDECAPPSATKDYTDEDWRRMGIALGESKILRTLKLSGLTEEAAEELFGRGESFPLLKILEFPDGQYRAPGLERILPVLDPLSALDTLDLSCSNLGVAAARLLRDALNETRIDKLNLSHNDISDEGLECILSSSNAKHLVELCLGKCALDDGGFEALSRFLRRDDTRLKALSVDANQTKMEVGREMVIELSTEERRKRLLVESLPKASKLEVLELGCSFGVHCGQWLDDVNDCLFNLVCDAASVESVCDSNHRLSYVNEEGRYPYGAERCRTAFGFNAERNGGGSVSGAIRKKLQAFYFVDPNFDVKYFDAMDVALMPHLLELVQTGHDHASTHSASVIYRLLKNCHVPGMFSFPRPKSIFTLLWEKDEQIKCLKTENESIVQQLKRLKLENEELRHAGIGIVLPNKRTSKVLR